MNSFRWPSQSFRSKSLFRLGHIAEWSLICLLGFLPHRGEGADAPEGNLPPEQKTGASLNPQVIRLLQDGYQEISAENGVGAVEIFKQVLEIEPDNFSGQFGLATALISIQQNETALDLLLKMHEKVPNDYYVLNNLAWLCATAKDLKIRDGDKAVLYARAAVVIAPMNHFVWNTLSEAYFVAGQYERALRAAQEALKLAVAQNAPEDKLQDYQKRIDKCTVVVKATSILDA